MSEPVMTDTVQTPGLGALPFELLTLIALSSDSTTTVLNLCATNKLIYDGLFRPQTFAKLISARRHIADRSEYWDKSLISERAGDDAMLWARFAKADEQAIYTTTRAIQGHFPKLDRVYHWIGELAVAKHPIVREDFWRTLEDKTRSVLSSGTDHPPHYIFAKVVALLYGAEHGMSPNSVSSLEGRGFGLFAAIQEFSVAPTTSSRLFLWVLRDTLIGLYSTINMRRRVWPFTNSAIHPDIPLPKIDLMPLSTVESDIAYGIPVPFAKACRMNDSQSWTVWYKQHTQALLPSIFEGEWQGYYSSSNVTSDPPMTGIHFVVPQVEAQLDPLLQSETTQLAAHDCSDGVGLFRISGALWTDKATGEIKIAAKKHYLRHSWSWNLRLTPFGLVGFWGNFHNATATRETFGTVWLWKKEWCAV